MFQFLYHEKVGKEIRILNLKCVSSVNLKQYTV